ncbi:ribosomal L7Ae/L30e/S12e/Gadd45 family protein [Candidatus Woesearchaeota archaeon]|nr:ribosomal L7Ae/L30e/S12e/Gadd45 family protein [Candidatus Woesearchaeota archaeon]
MEALAELRKSVQGGKLVLGTDETVKLLKLGKLARVFVASNCMEKVKAGLMQACEAQGCEILDIAVPNDELGILCKKPFPVAVVGILK